jgi:hypothetical protein
MQVLTQVLCRLLSNPEYIEALRQETDAVIAQEGWKKAGIDRMRKLDSFIRETQRMDMLAIGLSGYLHSSPISTDTCPSSGYDSSRSATVHIF